MSDLAAAVVCADVAHLVEYNLAKVGVAGSSPVIRSKHFFADGGLRRIPSGVIVLKCNNARGTMSYGEWLLCPYYKRASKGLDYQTTFANQALVSTLADIPITPLKPGKKRRR